MKPNPEVVELDYDDLQSKLNRIEEQMGKEMAEPFRQLLTWYTLLLRWLREKTISIQRLRKMIFGPTSEQTSQVLGSQTSSSEQPMDASPEDATTHAAEDAATHAVDDAATHAADDAASDANKDVASGSSDNSPSKASSTDSEKKKAPGHGRIPAEAFTGCPKVIVTHDTLHPGDACPDCAQGTVYRQSRWSPVVRLKGQTPVGGTVYQLERLRCHLCGRIHTAPLPEEAGPKKHDPTVASIIATFRYGEGMPWNRFDRMQLAAGIPMPASTQWEVVRDAVECGPRLAYNYLLDLAAQGDVVHNDDTGMCVLELMKMLKDGEPIVPEDPDRCGIFATSILSLATGRPPIALFFTGPRHSGENLATVLARRLKHLPNCIQMCDALSRNMPRGLPVIVANCLVHARRNFVEVVESFRPEVTYVLQCLKKVYQVDSEAKDNHLSPEERLRLHQEHSGPVMNELHQWLKKQQDEKKVEPNSSLGGAISYMLNHWDKLTLFLRVAGAPLDNNICERAIKMAIRHRKNSLFYKTMRGAEVGDLYMSLIYTCYLAKADPFDYLTQLQKNYDRVQSAPGDWMPWNYKQQLSATPSDSASSGGASDQAPSDLASSGGASQPAPSDSDSGGGACDQAPSHSASSGGGSQPAPTDSQSSGGACEPAPSDSKSSDARSEQAPSRSESSSGAFEPERSHSVSSGGGSQPAPTDSQSSGGACEQVPSDSHSRGGASQPAPSHSSHGASQPAPCDSESSGTSEHAAVFRVPDS